MATSTEDATRDVIYRLLLSKLMEAQSSSLVGPPPPAAVPAALPVAPSIVQHLPPVMQPQLAAAAAGAAGPSLSPPSSSSSTSSTSFSISSPIKDRIGIKRPSPYNVAVEATVPQSTSSSSFSIPPQPIPPQGGGGPLPNFLLVKLTDVRQAEKLQSLLARHGFTETRLVLANDTLPVQPATLQQQLLAPQPRQQILDPYLSTVSGMPNGGTPTYAGQDIKINNNHAVEVEDAAPEAVREEVIDGEEELEEEDENVDVVDDSSPVPSSSLTSAVMLGRGLPGASSATPQQLSSPNMTPHQTSPPARDEPPSDIQVAEVRHRSVSRSDGVDNEDVYVKCRLCENRIMNTRLSNLTNHVRRHAKLKQFQCAHCSYEHNEIFKVRTHMSRAHNDSQSAPLDRRSPEMERQWEALMHACFPRSSLLAPTNAGSSLSSNGPTTVAQLAKEQAASLLNHNGGSFLEPHSTSRQQASPSGSNSPRAYTCSICNESVMDIAITTHARERHRDNLAVIRFYVCRDCGFKASEKDQVRHHALYTHDVADVVTVSVDQRPSLVAQKMFPGRKIVTNDEVQLEEEEDEVKAGEVDGVVFTCRMCSRQLRSQEAALSHAKHHYPTKQFHCTLCLYAAVDEAKVRAHLLTRHMSIDAPINVANAPMRRGWLDTMESCFPELAAIIDHCFPMGVNDIGEDLESDTKRRKLERAAASQDTPDATNHHPPQPTNKQKYDDEDEDEEIDVV